MSLDSARYEEKLTQLENRVDWLLRQRDELAERERQLCAYVDELSEYRDRVGPAAGAALPADAGVSFIVAAYEIPRQIRRTLESLRPAYQGVDASRIQVIVVDNGSTTPLAAEDLATIAPNLEIMRVDGYPSPVFGLNKAIERADHDTIALMIDGAHLLSPGVVQNALEVMQLHERPVINVPQYLMGAVSQNLNVDAQVDPFDRETADLESLGWPENGYRLFEYAVKATEMADRNPFQWAESNCLITTRTVLEECGAFDERFDEPGAGMANVELFHRLTHEPRNSYVILAGEGSFHQDHHGTTTGVSVDVRKERVAQYHARNEELFGYDFPAFSRSPFLYGTVRNATQTVPTISTRYGEERHRLLNNLAKLHVDHLLVGSETAPMYLTDRRPQDEHVARPPIEPAGLLGRAAERAGLPETKLDYLEVLNRLHELVKPKLYLEIGIDNGMSLRLAKCARVGLDPEFELTMTQAFPTKLFKIKSDTFFANEGWCANHLRGGVDLAYIDGMHLSEFVVRDFLHVERWMNADGVVVIDDVLPGRIEMAERERRYAAWCGDVYRVVSVLREYRPDLSVQVVDAFAGPYRKGLAVVTGLNPDDSTLADAYDEIAERLAQGEFTAESIDALEAAAASISIPDLLLDIESRVGAADA